MQVTLIESERLPPQSICIKQLVHKPFVTAVPLGHQHAAKIVAQVSSVLDEKGSPIVVTVADSETGEETVAQLSSLMVPFTLAKSAQLSSKQPRKFGESTSWKSTVPAPSAWTSPAKGLTPIADTQGGHGLKVRKRFSAGGQRNPDGAIGSAWDGQEYCRNAQDAEVDRGDAAQVCCSSTLPSLRRDNGHLAWTLCCEE